MSAFGHDSKSMARALQRSPQSVRVKCVELGVRLRPAKAQNRRVQLPVETWRELRAAAERYNMTASRLANLLIVTIVKDDLFKAVIDPPPATRRPMAKMKVDPMSAALGARQQV